MCVTVVLEIDREGEHGDLSGAAGRYRRIAWQGGASTGTLAPTRDNTGEVDIKGFWLGLLVSVWWSQGGCQFCLILVGSVRKLVKGALRDRSMFPCR